MDTPSIYVACLASYNNAILHGVWIDATQSEDDIMKEIWEMLDNSTEPNAEEYAIHDYEGFGSIKIHEYEGIHNIVEYASFIQEHAELGLALLRDYSIDDAQTMLKDHYQGCYDSEVDFARQLFDDCYAHQMPDSLICYFDFDAFARDLFMSDYYSVETNGQTNIFLIY
ncbi:antirestriction protein ArdA [Legionella anisa]|uniref:Antirestriction protein ArdA n=1 Tax=Legionella anisa TaxID=28082 RepID=A0AAX0WVP4_9GAMM|nr:antirestriction protein ArdA [Legionella anisa]MDW9132287.1 antirestriction protein ArdA [Legionella pneumophila]AWN73390.1 antirestriction protein ArdA [Legionella anisa]KTC70501.1 antirestriction protein [Legionella anisa]MBN5934174.1 antirestriction protein ArdA [Legionella anisa]MCW8426254.1 antirestriction protein ArdA [Legionella anisa]